MQENTNTCIYLSKKIHIYPSFKKKKKNYVCFVVSTVSDDIYHDLNFSNKIIRFTVMTA